MSNRPSKITISPVLEAALKSHEAGRIDHAEKGYLTVLSLTPNHPIALLYLGVVHHDRGQFDKAIETIKTAISLNEKEPAGYNHLGLAYLGAQKIDVAISVFQKAVELNPRYVDALNNLGNAFKHQKSYLHAESSYKKVLKFAPNYHLGHYNLGLLYFAQQQIDDAEASFLKAISLSPNYSKAHHHLGLISEMRGNFEQAAQSFEMALSKAPNYAPPLVSLLGLRSYEVSPEYLRQGEMLANSDVLHEPESFTLCYSLAKRFDNAKDFDRAFEWLDKANRRRGVGREYNRQRVENRFAAYQSAFDKATIERLSEYGAESSRPVFILGMPRTGTTLTEQILASHSEVYGAGELPDLPRITNAISGWISEFHQPSGAFPNCMDLADASVIERASNQYLKTINERSSSEAKVSDKNPFNFLNVGLIQILFPNAKIIHCQRNPLDVGISCFMELFELKQDFTTNFSNFGHYFGQYQNLMSFWKREIGAEILDVSYEALIDDTESVARAIVNFCGLDWDPNCLNYTRREAVVLTPSKWQVRQPIYKSSRQRWRNYERHITSLVQALNQAGVTHSDVQSLARDLRVE